MRLPDDDSLLVDQMVCEIKAHSERNALRTAYVEGEHRLANLGVTIPPPMQSLWTVVGWPKKAVDVLASRFHPEGYRLPRESDVFDTVNESVSSTSFKLVESMAIESSIRHGCAFVFTSRGEDGESPVVYSMKTAEQATVLWDHRLRRPIAALEFIEQDVYGYYTPQFRYLIVRTLTGWDVAARTRQIRGRLGVSPYTYDASGNHPLGQSRVTNTVMGLTDDAVRTILRQEVSAEFYSSPQRYMLGADQEMFTDENGKLRPAWATILGSMLVAPNHVDEETLELVTPKVGQFSQQSMQPHSDHLRSIAMMFSGETSIPPSYLGIIHDNPASASAILANEADLITTTETHFPEYDAARQSVFLDTASVLYEGRDDLDFELRGLSTRWRDAATPNAQSQAQAVTMLVSNGILPPQSRITWEMMGFDDATIRRLENEARRSGTSNLLQSLQAAADRAGQDPAVAELAVLPAPSGEPELDSAAMKQRFDALGVAVRAGVDPDWAATRLGLDGAEFTGAVPVQLRMPEKDAVLLEDG